MSIIDTPFNTVSKIPCLLSNGVKTVIRYYNFSNSGTFPQKCLNLAEAQALSANGLRIAVVFQQRQNQIADFSHVKGVAAGRRAYQLAQNSIGQPPGSAIFFSVDFDASKNEIDNSIIPYFEGIKSAFDAESLGNPEYKTGAYGSGLVCGTLTTKGLIERTWLSMSGGFRGTASAVARGEFDLLQKAPEKTLCGLGVDFNEANPAKPDFGFFSIDDEPSQPIADAAVNGVRHKVVARNGLRLREGPGKEFEVINALNPGQIVFVVKNTEGWAQIDVEGDGQIDGFASVSFLEVV